MGGGPVEAQQLTWTNHCVMETMAMCPTRRWSVQPVSFGSKFSGDIGYYDMEDWETDRTPNYLYGTLVPWVRMPFMDKTNGKELNDVISPMGCQEIH